MEAFAIKEGLSVTYLSFIQLYYNQIYSPFKSQILPYISIPRLSWITVILHHRII
jgi:hypothetical protein